MSKSKRQPQMGIIIGSPGTGKSTLLKEIADKIPGRKLIVTYDGQASIWRQVKTLDINDKKTVKEWKSGYRHTYASWYDLTKRKTDLFTHIHNNLEDVAIIFDDCREYMPAAIDDDRKLRQILIKRRHLGYDMFFIVHSPDEVPPRLWGYYNFAVVLPCDSIINTSRIRLSSAKLVAAAQEKVNANRRLAEKANKSVFGIYEVVKW